MTPLSKLVLLAAVAFCLKGKLGSQKQFPWHSQLLNFPEVQPWWDVKTAHSIFICSVHVLYKRCTFTARTSLQSFSRLLCAKTPNIQNFQVDERKMLRCIAEWWLKIFYNCHTELTVKISDIATKIKNWWIWFGHIVCRNKNCIGKGTERIEIGGKMKLSLPEVTEHDLSQRNCNKSRYTVEWEVWKQRHPVETWQSYQKEILHLCSFVL